MSKKIENDEPPNWGCPLTEMRTRHEEFKASTFAAGLTTFMTPTAPHYANRKTRIAYTEWEKSEGIVRVLPEPPTADVIEFPS